MAMSLRPFFPLFPPALARDRTWTWELMGRTVSGGRAFGGAMNTARFDGGGLWVATLSDVQVSTADQVAAWKALGGLLDGGSTPVVMEAVDPLLWPVPRLAGVPQTDVPQATHSDGATLDDGQLYAQPLVDVTVAFASALRQTEIGIIPTTLGPLRGGEMFSIEHEISGHRLYRITQVLQAPGIARIRITPPLREATAAGTRCEFDRPKCIMQLSTADGMDLSLKLRRYGSASPRLIERLPPFADADSLTPMVPL